MRSEEMQKITVEVPKYLLDSLKESTGEGTTEIIRDALREKLSRQAQLNFLALRGSLKGKKEVVTLEEMSSWDDEDDWDKYSRKSLKKLRKSSKKH